MLFSALQKMERAIFEHLSPADLPSCAGDVKCLSDAFTKGRAELPAGYLDDPRQRAAYIAHFFLTNAAKVLHCLDEAFAPGLFSKKESLRILDLGSGPGTAALAASLFFAERVPGARLEILCVDRSKAALQDAQALFARVGDERQAFRTAVEKLRPGCIEKIFAGQPFDIIIAENLLNEFEDEGDATQLCRKLVEKNLARDGLLLLIDPALRETTRPLMRLRDELAASGAFVAAPCLHQGPCPMFAANERDWCHFYVEWERPLLIQRMDELTGLDHRYLKMAYVILKRQDLRPGTCDQKNLWRVVSSPLKSKGKLELVLCGGGGKLMKAMRQDKHASEANRDFASARRGDIVACPPVNKLSREDPFHIVTEWR